MKTIQLKLENIRSIFENQQAGFRNLVHKHVRPIQFVVPTPENLITSRTPFFSSKQGKMSYFLCLFFSCYCLYCYSWCEYWVYSSMRIDENFTLASLVIFILCKARVRLRLLYVVKHSSNIVQYKELWTSQYWVLLPCKSVWKFYQHQTCIYFQQVKESIWS